MNNSVLTCYLPFLFFFLVPTTSTESSTGLFDCKEVSPVVIAGLFQRRVVVV